MIWLIYDFLSFYAHVHACSPSYTDKERKKIVDFKTVCLRLLIEGLIVPLRLWMLPIAFCQILFCSLRLLAFAPRQTKFAFSAPI